MTESNPSTLSSVVAVSPDLRRHDLDAVRSFAMLLGIVLHAALAYAGIGWIVTDSSVSPTLSAFVNATHGFRMPLFFLLSGFFTMMLWRRRGLRGMLNHRAKHILIPLALGCVTIVPAMWGVSYWAITRQAEAVQLPPSANIWTAAAEGDIGTLTQLARDESLLNAQDETYGVTPLGWTVIQNQVEAAEALLERGADANATYRDKNAPLHTACFFGRLEIARLLLAHGADAALANPSGDRPRDVLGADRSVTEFFAKILKISIDFEQVKAAREQIAALLGTEGQVEPAAGRGSAWVTRLMVEPFFHHLWFLWILWWLVVGFSVVVLVMKHVPTPSLPASLFSLPGCLAWLIPLTTGLQAWMHSGGTAPGFGPDTSAGLIPMPHVVLYYAVFFGFGALASASRGMDARLGRFWAVTLPLGLAVFPLALRISDDRAASLIADPTWRRIASAAAQATFTWLMTFGIIGLFEAVMSVRRTWVRYLADSSYWMYLVHLPLVIVGQALLVTVPMPGVVKTIVLTFTITAALLVLYHVLVRRTWLGAILNGRRHRSGVAPPTDLGSPPPDAS